jgi:hypothetical protein
MAMNPRLLVPRATGFNPKSIANLAMWLDAADASTVLLDGSSNVEEWRDKSGNNRHATQTTGANRPDYAGTLNSKKIVGFAGSPEGMNAPAPVPGSTSRTVFVVAKYAAVGSTNALVNLSDGVATGTAWVFTTEIAIRCVSRVRVFGGGQTSTPQILAITQAGSSTSDLTARINGSLVSPTSTTAGTIDSTGSNMGIGYYGLGNITSHANCDLAEILVYSRALSNSERAAVEKYLSQKWGIALA